MSDASIEVNGLSKVFVQRNTRRRVEAIRDLTLSVAAGELVAIVGRSGCGKSTLARIIAGIERPTMGTALIGGLAPYDHFGRFKGEIGIIFQEDRLLPWRKVVDNVCLGLEILRVSRAERKERALEWLERLGLGEFAQAYPHELSGGMRQRVALARAFCLRPSVLLADEAFGHLDEVTALELRREFAELVRREHTTTLFITHDLEEALLVGVRVLVFGRPSCILADLSVEGFSTEQLARVREEIQVLINTNGGRGDKGEPDAHDPEIAARMKEEAQDG